MLRRDGFMIWLAAVLAAGNVTHAIAQSPPLTGTAAFGDCLECRVVLQIGRDEGVGASPPSEFCIGPA